MQFLTWIKTLAWDYCISDYFFYNDDGKSDIKLSNSYSFNEISPELQIMNDKQINKYPTQL